MVLTRSNSGPGGLSINTSSANSLFGSNPSSQAPQSGSLFGSSTKPTTSLFGAATSTQAQPTTGLFGSAPSNQTQPSTGLFGPANTTSQSTSGLFGTTNQVAPATGGLFGSSTSGSLFGNTVNTSQPAQPSMFGSATSRFGSSLQVPSQQQGPGNTSLFGGFGQPSQQPAQAPLFAGLGASSTNRPSLFSQTAPAPAPAQAPSLRFGGGPTNTPAPNTSVATVPAVRIDASNLRPTTRFSELTDFAANELVACQQMINQHISASEEIGSFMEGHGSKVETIPRDAAILQRRSETTARALENDTLSIDRSRAAFEQDLADAKLSLEALRRLNLPPGYQNGTSSKSADSRTLLDLFASRAQAMNDTLAAYKARLVEVDSHVRNVEAALGAAEMGRTGRRGGDPTHQLSAALKDFEAGILAVAQNVGGAREAVQSIELR